MSQLDPGFEPVKPEATKPGLDDGFEPVYAADKKRQQEGVQQPWEPNPDDPSREVEDVAKLTLGIFDLAGTAMTAGVAEPFSGVAGMISFLLSGDADYAAKRVGEWQDFFTKKPWSEGGEYLLRQALPPLSKADDAINDWAEEAATNDEGEFDPAVAAAIKTGIWSSIDIAAFAFPGGKAVLQKHKLRKLRKQIIKEADRLGIKLTQEDFHDDVADAARTLGSEHAGEQAIEYTEALRQAERSARNTKNSLYAAAEAENLYVATSPVRQLGERLLRQLDKKYNLDDPDMESVRNALNDLRGHTRRQGMGSGTGLERGRNIAVHFSKIERIRSWVNKSWRKEKRKPEGSMAAAALMEIRHSLDNWLTAEFNRLAIQDGKIISSGVFSGDAGGIDAYQAARRAAQEHAWFFENKAIADLIDKDASVDQVAHWIIGSSRRGKIGAAKTVEKIHQLLGPDHPAFEALRQDFIFQLTKPLLADEPNFKAFRKNVEFVLQNNKPLADAFGLDQHDIKILADFALAAEKLPGKGAKAPRLYTAAELVQTIARLGVGSDVAKGAARVGFATKIGNLIFGVDRVSYGQLTGAVVDARFEQQWIPRASPVYLAIMAGAALSGNIDNSQDKLNTFPGTSRAELIDSFKEDK